MAPVVTEQADHADQAGQAEQAGQTGQTGQPEPQAAPSSSGRRFGTDAHVGDRIFRGVALSFGLLLLVLLAAIAWQVGSAALPSIRRFGFSFFTNTNWDPVRDDFGALPFLFGTVVSSGLALAMAIPISLGIAIFLTEYAPAWIRTPASFLVELLAAVPSVIYGLWGVFALAPWLRESVEPRLEATLGFLPFFRGPSQGIGLLAASLILAVMILPTISSVSREVLRAVPYSLKEAAIGLGATRWETMRFVVLPYTRTGILGAVILGLGRALGETMAVTMVIGNRPEISSSIFAPAYTMASVIANEFTEATGDLYVSALAEIALALFGVTLILNLGARLLVSRIRVPAGARL